LKITSDLSDDAALAELGARLRCHRLALDWTQRELAEEAGVSKRTLERIEAGRTTQTDSLFRVLRALGLLENLEAVVPPPLDSPLRGARRQRARGGRGDDPEPWTWREP
jgi:transcriptional regulator with XRE-family HTH domain